MGDIVQPDDFIPIPRTWLRDRTLSLKAKGLLAMLQQTAEEGSGPNVGQPNVGQLIGSSRDGRESVLTGLRELEDARYLRRTVLRGPDGKIAGHNWALLGPSEPLSPFREGGSA
ncbi:MAG TPA: hypothetical protein VF180_13365 [Acidimicrobiia bacterium]